MALQQLNLGQAIGDNSAEGLRSGGLKINENFTELYGNFKYTANQNQLATHNRAKILMSGDNLTYTFVNGTSIEDNVPYFLIQNGNNLTLNVDNIDATFASTLDNSNGSVYLITKTGSVNGTDKYIISQVGASGYPKVSNISSLESLTQFSKTDNSTVQVLGYYSEYDGGGGLFYWDSTSTETPVDGIVVQVNGVSTGRYKRFISDSVNVLWFGADKTNTIDSSSAFQKAVEFVELNDTLQSIFIPAGTYRIENEITATKNIAIVGDQNASVIIDVKATGTDNVFAFTGSNTPSDFTVSVQNISFVDDRDNADKNSGYAVSINGKLNAVVKDCRFNQLGGGAFKTINSSNNTCENLYIFGCGNATAFRSADNGAIHIDRDAGFSNSLNVVNCYVSNCSFISGFYGSSHVLRLINFTVESCENLLTLGDLSNISRNITIVGLYMENARNIGIKMTNLDFVTLENVYFNDSNGSNSASIQIDNCTNVTFNNCDLGDVGFVLDRPSNNVKFNNCSGKFPDVGNFGINDRQRWLENDFYYASNAIATNSQNESNDFTAWTGSATLVSNSNGFLDGITDSWEISKTTASHDIVDLYSGTYPVGTKLCFSFYLKGKATVKFRNRRDSDNVYEDSKIVEFKDTGGKWQRVFIALETTVAYNLVRPRITPENYGTQSGTCEIAHGQMEFGVLEPGGYLYTDGESINQKVYQSVNGARAQNGKVITHDTVAPTTGEWNQGDIVYNLSPSASGFIGWVCTASGTPGTWKTFGVISA